MHTVKQSAPTGLSSTADDDATDNKSLPGYDEIDEDKAVLSLPTYETASKLNTTSLKTKGTSVALTYRDLPVSTMLIIYRSLWYRQK